MPKEQEVIEYFKEQIDVCFKNAEICDDNNFDEEATYLREEGYMLETALNILKEKDKEIEKKNEILNKVYDFIWENDCCRYFSKKHTLCNQVLNFDSCLGNCKRDCIKQYFKSKATNDG